MLGTVRGRFSRLRGYAAASCSSTSASSAAIKASAADALAPPAPAAAGPDDSGGGRGKSRRIALERRRSDAASSAARPASSRAMTSSMSSSAPAPPSSSSSGNSGTTIWYSFVGAGRDANASLRSLRTSAARALAPRASAGCSMASGSLMLSESRSGVADTDPGTPPKYPRAGVPAVVDGVAPPPRDGVPPGVAAMGLGVAARVCALGVIPEKSEPCSVGFSPPSSGVCPSCSFRRFCASCSTASCPPTCGVRAGVAEGVWP
mmetsp:Transcript_2936/g.7098  ORF Transcript_2936/g.7098 Transcript_2936/m.7098 type:complete len:262 (-) Transcript_2936:82-867(-)